MNTFDVVVRVSFQGNPGDEQVRDLMTQVLRNSGKTMSDHAALGYVEFVSRQVPLEVA